MFFVISSNLEGKNLNTTKHLFHVNQQFLSVPDIVAVGTLLSRVSNTSGVSAGNEMSNSTANARACVPEDFSGATVVHRGRPDGKKGVFGINSFIIPESLVLSHTSVKGYIIIFAPSTKWVKQEDGVLVTLFDKLYTSVAKKEAVTIMKGISDLESVDGVGTSGDH